MLFNTVKTKIQNPLKKKNEVIELFQMASSMKAKNRNMDSIISFPKPTLFIANIHYFLFVMLFSLLLSISELTLIFLPNITHIYEVVCVYLKILQ